VAGAAGNAFSFVGVDSIIADERLRLRLEESADAAFLLHLFKTTRAEQFGAAGLAPAVLDALLEQQFCLQARGYSAQFPDATSLLIEWMSQPAGRLLLQCGGHDWHIVDIALLASRRSQGIGTSVIAAVAAAARRRQVQALSLAVLATNDAARRLYRRLGFVDIDINANAAHIEMRKDLVG
jgi:ribosomal protein S18 acetylase RimI-like enzyme